MTLFPHPFACIILMLLLPVSLTTRLSPVSLLRMSSCHSIKIEKQIIEFWSSRRLSLLKVCARCLWFSFLRINHLICFCWSNTFCSSDNNIEQWDELQKFSCQMSKPSSMVWISKSVLCIPLVLCSWISRQSVPKVDPLCLPAHTHVTHIYLRMYKGLRLWTCS